VPSYPEAAAAPAVKVWERADWTPPACTGWSPSEPPTLVATAAHILVPGGTDVLRRRIGAVSQMKGLLYWSTTHQKWQPLILDAYALTAADGARRSDFSPEDLAKPAYIFQEDNLLGKVVYEIRLASASPDRLVVSTHNVTAVRYFGVPLFQPGELQSVLFLDREPKDIWRYYALTRLPKQAGVLLMGNTASLVNRAVAMFRYLAAIPADREPPTAR